MNKVQKINSGYKGSFHQWLQGVLFALYTCNACTVEGTDIDQSVIDIGRDLPFPIELSSSRSREVTSEVKQALNHFKASSPPIFRQRAMFNILVYLRRLSHRELLNKVKLLRELDTVYLMLVIKQVDLFIKYVVNQKLVFKTKEPYIFLEEATHISY